MATRTLLQAIESLCAFHTSHVTEVMASVGSATLRVLAVVELIQWEVSAHRLEPVGASLGSCAAVRCVTPTACPRN